MTEDAPWAMLFTDNIVLMNTTRKGVERKLHAWQENRGLRNNRRKAEWNTLMDKKSKEI